MRGCFNLRVLIRKSPLQLYYPETSGRTLEEIDLMCVSIPKLIRLFAEYHDPQLRQGLQREPILRPGRGHDAEDDRRGDRGRRSAGACRTDC